MKIIKDDENRKISIVEQDKILLDMHYLADEFVCKFYSDDPITITEKDDSIFYNGLKELMSNNYLFYNNELSSKTENKLVWLSDQYGDLENKDITDRISRLIIEKKDDSFQIFAYNPFLDKNEIHRRPIVTAFSPLGDGYYAKNMITGGNLQDDFINLLYNPYFIKKDKQLEKQII